MATRRKVTAERLDREGSSTPTQEDEADILDEVDAESGENGELTVPEDKIREVGAVDAESVRENRRVKTIVGKKRANVPNVSFNTGDVISTYDAILQVWPANSLEIRVRRLTGTAAQYLITSRPRSGAEFYEALRTVHGPHEETEYEIIFVDFGRKEWRGKGKITMPDARPLAQQGQPPMYQQYSPPGYAPHVPPGYAPHPPQSHPAYPPQPQPQVPGIPAQPPIVMQAPPGPDMGSMMATMQQMFEMFQAMQRQASPQQPSFAPPPQFVMPPPPPPPGSDSNAQMAWMRQAFDMFQSMRPTAAPQQQPQQSPAPPAPAASGPTMAPPPGMMWGWIPGFGFALMPAGGGPGPGMGPSSYRRPPPYQQGDREREPPPYQREQQPPQRERTAAEQFREAMTVVRTAVDAVSDMQTMLPNMGGSGFEAPSVGGEDDDSPVKVIDTGKGKFVLDKNNGGFRGWESLYANLPDLLKWAGEQREEIQKSNALQQQQRQPQRLPPGYVEVGPGYQPPPGFVAIPVDSPLPPPPANMPPPIQPRPPQSWGAPIISEPEESQ